jgi:hypothetical protein
MFALAQRRTGVPGLDAIWTQLESAVRDTFSPHSPYGVPALGGALLFSALYYVSCRQTQKRRMSPRGFVRTIFARRVILHPSSLVDLRLWALNGIVFAAAYGFVAFGFFSGATGSTTRWSASLAQIVRPIGRPGPS